MCFLFNLREKKIFGGYNKYTFVRTLNKRTLFLVSVSLIFVVVIIGGFVYWTYRCWYSEQTSENLRGYVAQLEDDGYIVEYRPLTDFQVDNEIEWYWFSDFRSYAKQVKATDIYIDSGRETLFFLRPSGSSMVAEIFYYKARLF